MYMKKSLKFRPHVQGQRTKAELLNEFTCCYRPYRRSKKELVALRLSINVSIG